jgi:CheY-like chemotaxis protein
MRILVVSSSKENRKLVWRRFKALGVSIFSVSDLPECIDVMKKLKIDLLLLDHISNSQEWEREIHKFQPETKIVII